jgi:hypothetical protein
MNFFFNKMDKIVAHFQFFFLVKEECQVKITFRLQECLVYSGPVLKTDLLYFSKLVYLSVIA